MAPSPESVLKSWLHLISVEKRNEAILRLAILGIRFYFSLRPGFLVEESFLISASNNELDELFQISSQILENYERKKNSGPSKSNKGELKRRISRSDAMTHYPFADEEGNVKLALTYNEIHPNLISMRILKMGKPSRLRLIQKTFNEMKYDRKGIKLQELPEALQRVGIEISSKLRNNLINCASSQFYDDEQKSYFSEIFIDEEQWKNIVKSFLRLMNRGYRSTDIETLDMNHLVCKEHLSDGIEIADEVDRGDEAKQDPQKTNNNIIKNDKKRSLNLSEQSSKYLSRIKKVPSRLSSEIRKDRNAYLQSRHKIESAATSTLARRRLDALTSPDPPPNRYNFTESNTTDQLSYSRRQQKPTQSGEKVYRSMTDLNSGAAALGIADSFLNGFVGRDLLGMRDTHSLAAEKSRNSSSSSSSESESLSLQKRQEKAAGLLGVNIIPGERKVSSKADSHYGVLKEEQQDPQGEGEWKAIRSEAPSGTWRSSRGGWVADFGAAHTHSLYSGPLYGPGRDALDGTSIAADRMQWLRNRRHQVGTDGLRDKSDQAMDKLIFNLADDLSALEATAPTKGEVSNGLGHMRDAFEIESIDSATAGAGEGEQSADMKLASISLASARRSKASIVS